MGLTDFGSNTRSVLVVFSILRLYPIQAGTLTNELVISFPFRNLSEPPVLIILSSSVFVLLALVLVVVHI